VLLRRYVGHVGEHRGATALGPHDDRATGFPSAGGRAASRGAARTALPFPGVMAGTSSATALRFGGRL
jgi:hypothetical protein